MWSSMQLAQGCLNVGDGQCWLRVYGALDVVEQVLLGELDSLLDSVDESPCGGLSTLISSGVAGGVSAGRGAEGI